MKNFEKIEAYLQNKLSEHERKAFLSQLKNDPQLQEELGLQKELDTFLELKNERDKLEIQVKDILQNRDKKKGFLRKRNYAAAASIVVLIGLAATMYLFLPGKTNRLYNQHYVPYVFSAVERSAVDFPENEMFTAQQLYADNAYQAYINYVDEHNLIENDVFIMQFLYAMALMETDSISEAVSHLESLMQKQSLYHETVSWYLGLCYLQQKEQEKAVQIFTNIASSENYYAKDARSILNKLE